MIDANNIFELFAKMKFYLWESTFNGKWVVFEAMPEETDAEKGKSKRSTSFEEKKDAEEYLQKKRNKLVAQLKATMRISPKEK